MGGSNLVIWKHTRQKDAAVRLIRSLISPDVQASFCQHIGLLPTHLEALQVPPYSTDPRNQVLAQAAQSGRSCPALLRWGLIEEHLSRTLTQIWSDLAANPHCDLDVLFARRIDPLLKRLNNLLAQSYSSNSITSRTLLISFSTLLGSIAVCYSNVQVV